MFKGILRVLVGVALAVQLTSCVYSENDRHYHPFWHHDPGVDVQVHG